MLNSTNLTRREPPVSLNLVSSLLYSRANSGQYTVYTNNSLSTPDAFLRNTPGIGNNSNFRNISFNNEIGSLGGGIIGRSSYLAIERLKRMSPQELKEIGQRNKAEFFRVLLPAAIEAERRYGVPASVTLAQAALESGWARSPIGGYNIFGIKGRGPAGTVNVRTQEFVNGRYITIYDNFAKYNNFYEAVIEHGKLFQKHKNYVKGVEQYAIDKNDHKFIQNIGRTYATSPTYTQKIQSLMNSYNLVNMSRNAYYA